MLQTKHGQQPTVVLVPNVVPYLAKFSTHSSTSCNTTCSAQSQRVPILIEYNSRTGEYSRIYTHFYSPNILIKYKLSRSQYKRTEIYDFYTAKYRAVGPHILPYNP